MSNFQKLADFRQAVGGSRFIITAGCSAVNSVLFTLGLLSESGYLSVLAGTVFAFIAAGTTQDIMALRTGESK